MQNLPLPYGHDKDPSFGIACLRKVNVVYENGMDLMIKLYQFVAKLLKPGGSLYVGTQTSTHVAGTRLFLLPLAQERLPRTCDVRFFSYYCVGLSEAPRRSRGQKMGVDEIFVVDLKKGAVSTGKYEGTLDASFTFSDDGLPHRGVRRSALEELETLDTMPFLSFLML
ncbi:hypothetical protein ZWY2020_033397 [Hordeum vulgare]|nr:hypothetical protein ZWY2020_033397 [Hordeum vulgare]